MEAVAEANTIVFDKTGTLTKAKPAVAQGCTPSATRRQDELLCLAACLEEHFPHSMAKAVVSAAAEKGLDARRNPFQGGIYRCTRHCIFRRRAEGCDWQLPFCI